MRLWIKFSKENPLRFLSHLDLLRLWQRAVRRARLPVAYSAGFNPHPKISFASALAVGITSSAEYLDIQFTETLTENEVLRLADALPAGIALREWRAVPEIAPAVMSLIRAAEWELSLPAESVAALQGKVADILAADSLTVEREGKKGVSTVEIRPLIYSLKVDQTECTLKMLLASGGEGGVRPREILDILGLADHEARLHRSELYIAIGDCLQSPLDVLLNQKEVSVNGEKNCYQL